MNIYKDFFRLTFEICACIFIIVYGLIIWDSYDLNNYETAKKYENTKEIQIDTNSNLLNNGNIVYVHNVSKQNNDVSLSFRLNNDIDENSIINIDKKEYILKDLIYDKDEYFYYIKLDKIDLEGYETKELIINVETNKIINLIPVI